MNFPAPATGMHFNADVMVIGSQRDRSAMLPMLAVYSLHTATG